MCLEFILSRLGVMNTTASWLAYVGRDALIGQDVGWLLTLARESIDRVQRGTRAMSCTVDGMFR